MGAIINADECIGCGLCAEFARQVFRLNDEAGRCEVIADDITDAVKDAAKYCPVRAISAV